MWKILSWLAEKWPFINCNFSFFFLQNWKNRNKKKIIIYVINFDPTKIFIDWAYQNDSQKLSFVKAINVVVKKMTRNGLTMANSYHCGLFARPVFTKSLQPIKNHVDIKIFFVSNLSNSVSFQMWILICKLELYRYQNLKSKNLFIPMKHFHTKNVPHISNITSSKLIFLHENDYFMLKNHDCNTKWSKIRDKGKTF